MVSGDEQSMQNQVKKEVDCILRETTIMIFAPEYNNQPGTISKEHRNPTLVSYSVALQRETENGPTIKNMATARQSKRPCVVLYGANNVFPLIGENKRQNRAPPETTTSTVEQETQSIESVDFTTSIWKD